MKLRLTESQFNRLKPRLNEGVNSKYSREVKVVFSYGGITLKGREINDIMPIKATLSYDIDIDSRSWGIKDISLYNISGPEQIEIEVNYYVDNDNTDDVAINLNLDWSSARREEEKGGGLISIGDEIEIVLGNGVNGGIVIREIIIPTYSL